MLNDKNGTIFNLKYRKGFLILVSGKGMEILYYFKEMCSSQRGDLTIRSWELKSS